MGSTAKVQRIADAFQQTRYMLCNIVSNEALWELGVAKLTGSLQGKYKDNTGPKVEKGQGGASVVNPL